MSPRKLLSPQKRRDIEVDTLRVAVLSGGRSSEREPSLVSGASVGEGLEAAGHIPISIDVGHDGVWRRDGASVTIEPGRGLDGADVVFPTLHGPFGEDGTVQGLLECLDVPYVGAGVLASALCLDKVAFKDLIAGLGMPQVNHRVVRSDQFHSNRDAVLADIGSHDRTVFVKPSRLGSSVGVTRVDSPVMLPAALELAFEYCPLAIVEEAATGVEVECAVIGNGDPIVSQPGEIVPVADEPGWLDRETKYTPGSIHVIVPARIPEHVRKHVEELAASTFVRTGCGGLARVDFFVDGERVLINEINTMPFLKRTSAFSLMFQKSGISFSELLDRLLHLALERHAARRGHRA
jgi:D-alanine-D-alanine ligase